MCNGNRLESEELPRDELIVEILRYLVMHPKAKDTIKGIDKWWLSGDLTQRSTLSKEDTLNLLVNKGWLLARSSPQAETIYSLNENYLSDIIAFLKQEP